MSAHRATMADVARRAGVSPSTVSLVLSGRGRELRISEAVEQRVLEAADELNYRRNILSVSLRTGTTRTIGFVSDTVATSRLAGDMIKGALEAAHDQGVMLFIGETEGDAALESQLLQAMHDRQVDGLVFASMFTRAIEVPAGLPSRPAVLLNAVATSTTTIPSVLPDEVEAGRAVARILLDAGHHDGIHLIGAGPRAHDDLSGGLAATERLTGLLEVLASAGVEISSGSMIADWQPEAGYDATSELLVRERPRALVCLNDRLAFGAYQALDHHGLTVPTDVSVVSFDDHPVATWMRPALTTVALPHYELGRAAVDLLFREIDRHRNGGAPVGGITRIPMPVRARGSVAAPPA